MPSYASPHGIYPGGLRRPKAPSCQLSSRADERDGYRARRRACHQSRRTRRHRRRTDYRCGGEPLCAWDDNLPDPAPRAI